MKTYSVDLSGRIVGGLSLTLSYEHIRTHSKLESVDAAENVYGITLDYKF